MVKLEEREEKARGKRGKKEKEVRKKREGGRERTISPPNVHALGDGHLCQLMQTQLLALVLNTAGGTSSIYKLQIPW